MGDMISQKLQDWDSNPSPSDSGAPHEPFSCSLEPFTGAAGLDDPRMGPALSGFWRPDWCSSLCPGGEHQVCPFPPHPTPPQDPPLVFVILGGGRERGHRLLRASFQSAWRGWAPGGGRKEEGSSLHCSRAVGRIAACMAGGRSLDPLGK